MPEFQRLLNQNAYLKQRCAQLQSELTDVTADNTRLRQMLERIAVPSRMAAGG